MASATLGNKALGRRHQGAPVVTLIFAGVMAVWASNFIGNEVHTQLAAQQIYFPAANSPAVAAPQFAAMRQYGGQ